MTEISHAPCPFCKSSDAFGYNDETGLFCCFSCGAKPSNKGGLCFNGVSLVPWEDARGNDLIDNEEGGYSVEPYIPDEYRGIKGSLLEKHGAYFTKDPDGKETVHYQYPNGTKHRTLPKSIKVSGKMDKFYGQDEYSGGRYISITEGEEDRLSIIQMMGDYPTVSVPGASPSKDFWANARSYLANFEKIVLSVDNDEAGDALAEKFYRMFPGKTYRVSHGKYKDANEFLQNGVAPQYKDSWWNAQKMKPEGFVSSPDQWEAILRTETPYEYVPTPIQALNKKIRGFTKGGITVVKALPGTGKTSLYRYWQHYLLKHTDAKFAVLHMEEMKATTGRGLVTYDMGVNVNTKEDAEDNGVSEEDIISCLKGLVAGDRFVTFDIDPSDPVTSILESIRVAREVYGVDFIFLDHLQRVAYLAGTDNATSNLTELAVKIVDMTRKDSWGFIAISHVNSDGATKYAKAVEEEAIMVLQLERDKDAADPEERDTTYITVTKNRPFGSLGDGGKLIYDAETTTLEEKIIHEPKVHTKEGDPF